MSMRTRMKENVASVSTGVGDVDASEGARRAGGEASTSPTPGAAPPPSDSAKSRWSRAKKRDAVLRLLRGESIDAVSRALGVEIYRLERWRERALAGVDDALRERSVEPLQDDLDAAMRRIGQLTMENELLHERCRRNGPFVSRTSKR